jgi:hypothetical protein
MAKHGRKKKHAGSRKEEKHLRRGARGIGRKGGRGRKRGGSRKSRR